MGTAFARVQRVGLSLLFPIAVLPAAGLLLRLGQADLLGQLGWLQSIHVPDAIAGAGNGIFAHLPLIFAIGVAIGLSEGNAGAAALAAAVGYLVFQGLLIAVYPTPGSADTVNPKVDTGVIGGIAIGLIAAFMYNHFRNVRLPDFLAFFGGRRFVPIATSFAAVGAGIVAWIVWPPINSNVINPAGNWMATSGTIGAGVYGMVNRLLVPLGLHHIPNTLLWTTVGTYRAADGHVYHGDLIRFLHGDASAGIFMTGFFPVMMFGLPAAALAIYHSAETRRRKAIAGLLLSAALTSIVTGITEPIEYTFLFVAPVLYGVHVVLTGLSLVITNLVGMHLGFSFSAGAIDYVLYWGLSRNQLLLFVIGPIYAVVYYTVFRGLIHVLDLKTLGREPEILDEEVGEGDLAEAEQGVSAPAPA
jgi:N-acetylglucosamine PTS system EIICBA or EIICB component